MKWSEPPRTLLYCKVWNLLYILNWVMCNILHELKDSSLLASTYVKSNNDQLTYCHMIQWWIISLLGTGFIPTTLCISWKVRLVGPFNRVEQRGSSIRDLNIGYQKHKIHFVAVFPSWRDTTSHLPYNDVTNNNIFVNTTLSLQRHDRRRNMWFESTSGQLRMVYASMG